MKKPDDDLRIDISEIFGGEITPLDSKSEELIQDDTSAEAAQSDANYQAFIDERNQILEVRTAEIESSSPSSPPPPEMDQAVESFEPATESSPDVLPEPTPEVIPEPTSEPAQEQAVQEPQPEEAIDFNAPMAPPFMGPAKSDTGNEKSTDSSTTDAKELKAEIGQTDAEKAAAAEAEAARIEAARIEAEKAEAARQIALQKELSFFLLFDEFRAIIGHELKDLVGERKTNNMLVKTFELAREKYPEVFRNANWDTAGTLLENGSLDGTRMAENSVSMDNSRREITVDMGLSLLMNLRMQAIEKGLGVGFKNKLRARLIQWVGEKADSAARGGKEEGFFHRLKNYLS